MMLKNQNVNILKRIKQNYYFYKNNFIKKIYIILNRNTIF